MRTLKIKVGEVGEELKYVQFKDLKDREVMVKFNTSIPHSRIINRFKKVIKKITSIGMLIEEVKIDYLQ